MVARVSHDSTLLHNPYESNPNPHSDITAYISQKSCLLSSVLRVPEVTFVTIVSSTSVIGQAMKEVLLPLGLTCLS